MTRRSRRASSGPQRVGSDEGLTSRQPAPVGPAKDSPEDSPTGSTEVVPEPDSAQESGATRGGGRHTGPGVEQTKDDTDEGWGEPGDDDAVARWLRENRPPHWS